MQIALDEARACAASGDVPVGAVVVADGEVVGRGRNRREADEVVALRAAAARLGRWRLDGATLVVTLEPCAMCAGAAVGARVDAIVFGAFDEKAGACGSQWDLPRDRGSLHRPQVYAGVMADETAHVLEEFFATRR